MRRATIVVCAALASLALVASGYAQQAPLQAVMITGVARNHSSAKISYQPVAGARDYRVYDLGLPLEVKYAGLAYLIPGPSCPGYACQHHFASTDGTTPTFPYTVANGPHGGPQVLDGPATDVEWNVLGDNQPHVLVVEAVDALGPVPRQNLYSGLLNLPLAPGGMLGSNKGHTLDGKLSTNGQGPFTNAPQVVARSRPFVVQADPTRRVIPSGPAATQTLYDTFDDSEAPTLHQTARDDQAGTMQYSLNEGAPNAWTIDYRQANNADSMPFIASNHLMDMLFDGATPGSGAPTHTSYGSMSMTPTQTVDISGGRVLHLTMEVDAHQSFRRWLAFNLAPADDPLTGWNPFGAAVNRTDRAIFLEFRDGDCTLKVFTGPGSAGPEGDNVWPCGWDQMFNPADLDINGIGRLDSRSRLDLFISQTHAALFEDDRLVTQADIPAGTFDWAEQPIKVYYSHYLYHSDADIAELLGSAINGAPLCYPLNSYWFNDPLNGRTCNSTTYPAGYGFPYSDERHWDNMGFEVLPPTADFAAFGALVHLPAVQPPVFEDQPSPAPTAVPTTLPAATPAPAGDCRVLIETAGQVGTVARAAAFCTDQPGRTP